MPVPSDIPPEITIAWDSAGARLGLFRSEPRYFSTVTSTNDVAMRLADAGADEGTIVVAEAQTAGRGRRGRDWCSPPGAGVYVSVILRPSQTMCRFPAAHDSLPPANPITARLTLASGVALAEGVRASTGLPVELKWPNDLVCDRRKLAGILAEMSTTRTEDPAVIVGIGINVRAAAYPSELASTAGSLETELGRPIDRALVLVETLAALASRYEDLRAGRFDAILTAWRQLARSLSGAAIEWDGPEGVVRGHAIDIDSTGALLARSGRGFARLVAGEVRWR